MKRWFLLAAAIVSLAIILLGIYLLVRERGDDSVGHIGQAAGETHALVGSDEGEGGEGGGIDQGGAASEPGIRPGAAGQSPALGQRSGDRLDAQWLSEQVEKWNPGWTKRVPVEFLEDPKNAFNRYLLAAAFLVPTSDPRFKELERFLYSKDPWWTDPEKLAFVRAYLDANAEALALLKAGIWEAEYYQSPPTLSFDTPLGHLAKFRGLARLLLWEGKVFQAKGDLSGTLENALAALKMGADVRNSTCAVENLVGVAIAAIGGGEMQGLLSDARDPELCRQAIDGLGELQPGEVNCSAFLRHELDVITGMCSAPQVLLQITSDLGDEEREKLLGLANLPERELRRQIAEVGDIFAPLIDAANSYPDFASLPQPEVGEDSALAKFMRDYWWPALPKAVGHIHLATAKVSAYQVLAGLKLCQLETGSFPETLGELVPDYLPAIPDDPFSGGPLKYVRTGDGAIVYSVGSDMKDDLAEKRTTDVSEEGDYVFEIR